MIGIIVGNNLRITPYAFYYTSILDELGTEYELIMPNRNEHLKFHHTNTVHVLPWNEKKNKVLNYISYSRALKRLAIHRYSFLIIPDTTVAVFCTKWLTRFFKMRYIIDVRDYTHENNIVYYSLEKKVLNYAVIRVISSKKYTTFLPKNEYLICHNLNTPNDNYKYNFVKTHNEIVIGYIGALSYIDQCTSLINLVASNPKFKLVFYGTGIADETIKKQLDYIKCDRIIKYGAYTASEKEEIISKIDILFNAYGNGYPLVDTAISNKLYDALYYHKPLITSPKTYMEELSGILSFSMTLKNPTELDELWKWYQELNPNEIDAYANRLYKELFYEHNNTRSIIKKTIATYEK